ncbi:DUF58 domain-containing protein [Natrarchaeobius chitinivorans]|uniref:DUF58 domain-containing protein n=1 Tax=Natrarchaeobius chitinivorans TaxID=1679083 RepID=A0A3N6NEV9_NATCH|nr:DUF58 domain-containing protein [Natrarchaeobius chitinivorans]
MAAAIVLVGIGVASRNGVLLLGSIVPLSYVAYGALSPPVVPTGLSVRRSISPTPAPPGRPVTVALSLTNASDRTLSDVRLADGVPGELAVHEGSPRGAATLEPGESLSIEYVVVARRGDYEFDPPQVRIRGLGAGAVTTATPTTAGDDALRCRLDTNAPPLERTGTDRVGQLSTDRPGEGVTFHSTREYRPDDPADRIDWRQYAKRGTLATVDYERSVAATVVLVVDAREPNRVVAGPGQPTAVELSAYAATRTLSDLLRRGHEVAVAAIGLEGPGPAGLHWLAPGSGRVHRSRALELLRTATDEANRPTADPSTEPSPLASTRTSNWKRTTEAATDGADSAGGDRSVETTAPDAQIGRLLRLAPAGAQLVLYSPGLDEYLLEAVETWRSDELAVSLVSPDVVPENTVSGQYAQIERRTRLARCRSRGTRTVDWRRGTPLPLIVEYAVAAESRLPTDRLATGSSAPPGAGGDG